MATAAATPLGVVVEQDVVPIGIWKLPRAGIDGVMRRRDGTLVRLMHPHGQPALVRAWVAGNALRLRAEARDRDTAHVAIARMRFGLGTDHDLTGFHRAFRRDPLIGPVIRTRPWTRPLRRAEPFEALVWAITEQLIELSRAGEIQRRIVYRFGPGSACGTLRDVPGPATLAGRAPAELEACGLAGKRAIAMVRVAREVASGRADLAEHEVTWSRLRRIREIGSWTLDCLAFHGQGRDDMIPAGDLAYVKFVGRAAGLGRRATEDEVRSFFAPYEEYKGLAGLYALSRRFA